MGFFDDIERELDRFGDSASKAGEEILGGWSGNSAKAEESRLNRQFQADQSATAHQRQVADLRAAGLNPILSGVGGIGAATSAGSMAQMEGGVGMMASSAVDTWRTDQEIKRSKAETENLTDINKNIIAQKLQIEADTYAKMQAGELTAKQIEVIDSQLPKRQTEAEFWIQALRALRGINKHIVNPIINRLTTPASSKAFTDATNAASALVNRAKESQMRVYKTLKNIPSFVKEKLKKRPGIPRDYDD